SSSTDTIGIADTLRALLESDQVIEARILNTARGTVSGYFNDPGKLAAGVMRWNGKASVYFTINRVTRALLARANNRLVDYAKQTTSDADIARRLWLPLDFDPVRPAGISSTDMEHEAALTRSRACAAWLQSLGFQAIVIADSGNGAHVLVRIDLPNDPAS